MFLWSENSYYKSLKRSTMCIYLIKQHDNCSLQTVSVRKGTVWLLASSRLRFTFSCCVSSSDYFNSCIIVWILLSCFRVKKAVSSIYDILVDLFTNVNQWHLLLRAFMKLIRANSWVSYSINFCPLHFFPPYEVLSSTYTLLLSNFVSKLSTYQQNLCGAFSI